MSGASPRFHDTLSGASGEGVNDYRTAGDVKLTRYFDRYAIGVGLAVLARERLPVEGASFDLRWWTDDRNTTLAFCVRRHVRPHQRATDGAAVNEKKNRPTSSSASRR